MRGREQMLCEILAISLYFEFQNNICSILYQKQNETTSLNERFYLDKTNRSGRRKVKIVQNIKAVG